MVGLLSSQNEIVDEEAQLDTRDYSITERQV